MTSIENKLREMDGGKVLDVATHEGHFVEVLMQNLHSYSEIVGIDVNEKAIEMARHRLGQENVRFLVMNAEHLDFENEHFDTVTISASLHHLADIQRSLGEMMRVLKPGGHFMLVEMHEDALTEASRTFVYLHQWVAEVDSALGILHNKTLARQEFVDYVTALSLDHVEYFDYSDEDADPKKDTRIAQLDNLIERTLQRAESADISPTLKARGAELYQRLHEVGAQKEPLLMIIGKKGKRRLRMPSQILSFEEINETDIPDLTIVMTRAFDNDVQKHLGWKSGGPEGYDTGEFFRKWLFGYEESEGYKILLEDKVIGGFIVWIYEHGKNILGTIFVDPAHQDRGIGTQAWQFIEAAYPDAKQWTLGTPIWAVKNHHFYEKCGFQHVETTEDSFVYRKEMP